MHQVDCTKSILHQATLHQAPSRHYTKLIRTQWPKIKVYKTKRLIYEIGKFFRNFIVQFYESLKLNKKSVLDKKDWTERKGIGWSMLTFSDLKNSFLGFPGPSGNTERWYTLPLVIDFLIHHKEKKDYYKESVKKKNIRFHPDYEAGETLAVP